MSKDNKHIQLRNISLYAGDTCLLHDFSFSIQQHDRIGIVGINGAGKTTLFKHLYEKKQPSEGEIEYFGNMTMGVVEQIHKDNPHTIWEEMESGMQELRDIAEQKRTLELKMSEGDVSTETLNAYAEAEERFSLHGGYTLQNDIHQILTGLKIPKTLWDAPLSHASGGQRTKIALGKILLTSPDLILLDEPTNFLDMESCEWLEYFLVNKWKKGYLIISHDRYFLDKVTQKTLEMRPGETPDLYPYAYRQYFEVREQTMLRKIELYKKAVIERERQEEIVQRLRAGSRASLAQSRMKMLDKMKMPDNPKEAKEPVISFKKADVSSDTILSIKDAIIGYSEDEPLYMIDSLRLTQGQRVGIIGPNGAGKSTLMKTLLSELDLLDGFLHFGKNIKLGYYSQHFAFKNEDHTILDEMLSQATDMTKEELRKWMGRFLFTGDEIYKPLNSLSGGERARVALAVLSLTPTNVLFMDEPTNHLDYLAREALENALSSYKGTILFISHDRYFIDKVATHLWTIDPEAGTLRLTYGNYTEYKEREDRGSFAFEFEEQEAGELLMVQQEKNTSKKSKKRK